MPSTTEQRRKLKSARRAAGRCYRCGRQPVPGKTRCIACIEVDNRAEAARKRRVAEGGKCARCGKNKDQDGRRHCPRCAAYLSRYVEDRRRKPRGGLVYNEWRMQGCADCPPGTEWPLFCMDAHHLAGKDRSVSWGSISAPNALDELAKCVPLCANHHRMRHAGIGQKNNPK